MRQASVTVSFEQERPKALRFYASKRGAGLEAELAAYLEKLYERYVPPQAREYIELLAQEESPRAQRAPRAECAGAVDTGPA